MDQPIEQRIRKIEERLDKFEQQKEPIKITRLEIDSGSMHKRLDSVQEDTAILKLQMEGARADIRVVKANQSDLRGYIEEQFKSVEAKQDAHTELLGTLISFAESHEKNMATKQDISRLEAHIAEQGQKLDLILQLLQPRLQ